MSAEKPRRLGRGLEALIGPQAGTASAATSDLQRIPIGRIRPNPYQPRRDFDPEQLADLEASLRASGLLQPITVRRKGDAYELIAGERRLRAATNIGWREISAVVRDLDDQAMLVLAMVENLQRADLNPLDEARGYRRLVEEFGLTQQQVADAIGKDRTTVANFIRLLSLPDGVLTLVESGDLSAGHARALLSLSSPAHIIELASEVVAKGLSVRDVERRAREAEGRQPSPSGKRKAGEPKLDPHLKSIETELRKRFQTDVSLEIEGPETGSVRIRFYSSEDFDRLLELLGVSTTLI